jgi:hypothetical protein
MGDHRFCRTLLTQASYEARRAGVKVPAKLTALRADRHQFFVEGVGIDGVYVQGDCRWEAKARYIFSLTDRKEKP